VMALFARPLGDALIGGADAATYLLLALGLVFAANVRQINLNVYRATNRFVARSAVELATTFGELVGMYLAIRLGYGLKGAFLFALAWEMLAAAATTAHAVSITGWGKVDLAVIRVGLAYSAPLISVSLAVWVMDRADRFVLNTYLGPRAVGIYSASYT